ncbi:HNH endonuclease [Bradyrhizobium sp.]|uniref:HNH endonuclease n=1 Tax=Bradyrhizobium sp. TaxID=376 RepID=UPI002BC6AA13|nr:HNH endonuclease [Bradyrhizobium sp.]HMM91845.1 HNH endonuclease [Bradyrhizobium sp.]
MARLQKSELLARAEEAIRSSRLNVLYLNPGRHPALYRVYDGRRSFLVQVYIWNITHGGRNRSVDEYRIQATGVLQFNSKPNARNLVLGWWDDVGVFAGWDIRQHRGPLGTSPSLQISETALRKAVLGGFAPYVKDNNETAIAFKPEFIGTYIRFLQALHDSGSVPAEAAILKRLSESPDRINERNIDEEVAEERKRALVSTWRAIRAIDFRERVLTAYSCRCAMCGIQLRLVDGAHILPVSEPTSSDRTANGIALCALHHRAYDCGLVTFDSTLKIHVNDLTIRMLRADDEVAGLKEFRKALRPIICAPQDKRDRPAVRFVKKANALRGWKL